MRRIVVSIVLVLMLVVIACFVASRRGVPVPLLGADVPARAAVRDAGVAPASRPAARAQDAGAAEAAVPVAPAPLLTRPLRVVATHWEVAAPILLASRGLSSAQGSLVDAEHLTTEIKMVATANEVEEALARGGGAQGGADVAVLPLATFVASYEHIAALTPQMFLAVAWSRGAESFFLAPSGSAERPLDANFALAADRASPSALTLMMLAAEMGVTPANVHVVAFEAQEALVAAVDREHASANAAAQNRTAYFTTADAARISPWVVIAPRAFQMEHGPALAAWARAWNAGAAELSRDVPNAARTIAAMQGAPPVIELLRRLGRIAPIGLVEQAELLGLAGRGYVTLPTLFSRAWVAERGLGALVGPPPEAAPVATGTVATLVLTNRGAARPPAVPAPAAAEDPTLLTFPLALPRSVREEGALEPLVTRIGFVSGVFARSRLRVVVTRAQAQVARTLVDQAVERYALDPARVEIATGTETVLRVLAPR